LSREQVAESQRRRILEAMVSAVGENGYAHTPVAAVIERAGVSRKAFYEHFPNKEACFAAAVEQIGEIVLAQIQAVAGDGGGKQRGGESAIDTLFTQALAYPSAVRLVLAELCAAGPEALAARERLVRSSEGIVSEVLGVPHIDDGPEPSVRAITGGVVRVLYGRACHGVPVTRDLITDLLRWVASYHPIPKHVLLAGAHTDSRGAPTAPGGRAPGSLSPPSQMRGSAGLRGESVGSHSFVVHNQRERILDALTNLGASTGYTATTINKIAARASVSVDTFYSHFASKEDAFLVAYEVGQTRGLALAEHACRTAPDWPSGVRAGIAALFDFYASEPAFAHLALVDAQVVAPLTAARLKKSLEICEKLLLHGLDQTGESPPALTSEAIVGGIYELSLGYTLEKRTHELSSMVAPATYFALAPLIGAKAAARVARP
jgi:AcrR family transcriptional regulator